MTLQTKNVQEVPAKPLIHGEAVYYDGENDTALEILDWLRERGVMAWATPKGASWTGMIRVDSQNSFNEDTVAWPDCWIIVQPNKDVVISPNHQFERRYIPEQPTLPSALYKNYQESI